MTFFWGNIQLHQFPSGPNPWQFATWAGCFLFSLHKFIFAMVEIDNSALKQINKNALKMLYFAHKWKAKVVSKFHLLQQLFLGEFPHLLQCSVSSSGNHWALPVHTQHIRMKPQPESLIINALRCQHKEQSCLYCPQAMICLPTPSSGISEDCKKKEKAGKALLNCVFQPKLTPLGSHHHCPIAHLWSFTAFTIIGNIRDFQPKAGAAGNHAVRPYSCCPNKPMSSTAWHKAEAQC